MNGLTSGSCCYRIVASVVAIFGPTPFPVTE